MPRVFYIKIMEYKTKDIETNEEITVSIERWVWGVIYKDGRELHQFGNDGIFHRIGEIEQENISMATLYRYDDMTKRIDIPWREGMKLIHKYRNTRPAGRTDFVKTYMFGYKNGDEFSYIFILPDDRIIFSPKDDIDLTKFNI